MFGLEVSHILHNANVVCLPLKFPTNSQPTKLNQLAAHLMWKICLLCKVPISYFLLSCYRKFIFSRKTVVAWTFCFCESKPGYWTDWQWLVRLGYTIHVYITNLAIEYIMLTYFSSSTATNWLCNTCKFVYNLCSAANADNFGWMVKRADQSPLCHVWPLL